MERHEFTTDEEWDVLYLLTSYEYDELSRGLTQREVAREILKKIQPNFIKEILSLYDKLSGIHKEIFEIMLDTEIFIRKTK